MQSVACYASPVVVAMLRGGGCRRNDLNKIKYYWHRSSSSCVSCGATQSTLGCGCDVPSDTGRNYLFCRYSRFFSRRVVGWSMSARQDAELMDRALQMADRTRHPAQVIYHSDHGSQHTSQKFRQACAEAKVKLSIGSIGDCYDNAMAESLFATLETELIDLQPRRLHSALNYRSPVAYERP